MPLAGLVPAGGISSLLRVRQQRIYAVVMTTAIDERADVARGRQVRIDGKVRTIPADLVPRFEEIERRVAERYPDDPDLRAAALAAAATYLVDAPPRPAYVTGATFLSETEARRVNFRMRSSYGELVVGVGTVDQYAEWLRDARAELAQAEAAARVIALLASEDGVPETALTSRYEIDRGTLRRWIGKRDR